MQSLERALRDSVTGDVLFDAGSRGRYATDASHYQVVPRGVVVPRSTEEATRALGIAAAHGVPVTARGGGTSQCGQTVNAGLVIDGSRHLDRVLDLDVAGARCTVEPGIVLDELNRRLKPHGLWFPVDVSTASRATIGGMVGNNSCGGRSLRYGTTRDNVLAVDAVLADGAAMHFGEVDAGLTEVNDPRLRDLAARLLAIGADSADEVRARFPAVQRRVGGYNLDALDPSRGRINLAHALVGSEGTLAYSTAVTLKLSPLLGRRGLGVCHFGSFRGAMEAAQHLVALGPIAIELVDRTMLELAAGIAMFRPTLAAVVRGAPEALLLVEFAEDDAENARRLERLAQTMGDLGHDFSRTGAGFGGVVAVTDPAVQAAVTELRTAGLNIMMSMKEARKPVSFVEDCAVPLAHLADYTDRLTQVFERHGTRGTWYAHASEGCLHVRPVLNLRLEADVRAMRAIAEEAFALVREYKGSHSGEHGDGLVRSEFHAAMYGGRIVDAFERVKDAFDPEARLNPGRIVRAPRFDDRALFRYAPGYAAREERVALDWSAWPGASGGLQGAVEMCNNNGACRKLAGGVMCPSYRATRDERDVTRGRANTLRLALTGQVGLAGLADDAVADAMRLCVSCKACRRECPTGVDMARMKIETLAARAAARGFSARDRVVGFLPRYARAAAALAPLLNLRDRVPALARLSERALGIAAGRRLPRWRRDRFAPGRADAGAEVLLWADTFNAAFDREVLEDAQSVLRAAGYRVGVAQAPRGRPLCCGRSFLSVGDVERARAEMVRTRDALLPQVRRGARIVGLEPSCLFTFRDELAALLPGSESEQLAGAAMLFEEFVAAEAQAGRFRARFRPADAPALLHGHCHQKAFGAMGAVEAALRLIPEIELGVVESSCCGMAGAFGYQAETEAVSRAMGELSLLPAMRAAPAGTILVADGTSCRHQIAHGAKREAVHVARVLARHLEPNPRAEPST